MTFPFFETLVFSIFDVLQYYVITNKINNGKLIIVPKHLIGIAVCSFCSAISSVSIEGVNTYFLSTIFFMILSWWLYDKKGFNLVYFHIIGMSMVLTIQLSIIFFMYITLNEVGYTSVMGMIAQTLGILLSLITAKYFPIHLMYKYVEARNALFRVISLNLFILLSFCLIYWYLQFEGIVENLIWISAIIVIVLFINLIFLKEGLKNQVMEEQNRAYELYLPIVNELVDDIRIKQHNFDNHIAALRIVLEQQTGDNALNKVGGYIQEIEQSFRNADFLKIKNRIIAGFLYSKKKQALEEGITFNITIENPEYEVDLKDYEMLDILSVLIDNAFETGIEGNTVKVHFYKEKNKSVIEVANKHPYISAKQINDFFINGYSTKSEKNRGLGLYKLKTLIAKNHGEIEVHNVDFGENYILFRVTLPSIS